MKIILIKIIITTITRHIHTYIYIYIYIGPSSTAMKKTQSGELDDSKSFKQVVYFIHYFISRNSGYYF